MENDNKLRKQREERGGKHHLTLRSCQEDLETVTRLETCHTKYRSTTPPNYLCFGEFKSSVSFFLKHVLSLQYLITAERKFPPFLSALNCNDEENDYLD